MGKGSQKHRSSDAQKNKLRAKATKLVGEGKSLRGKLSRYYPRSGPPRSGARTA